MRKNNLIKLAMLGLTGGLLLSSQGNSEEEHDSQSMELAAKYGGENGCGASSNSSNGNAKSGTQNKLNEEQLLQQLNENTKKIYEGLSPEGKALALKLANDSCKGTNDCKGQGSCKNADNFCAGMNSCKGKTPGPFQDKNQAVKAAAKIMANKRNKANGG